MFAGVESMMGRRHDRPCRLGTIGVEGKRAGIVNRKLERATFAHRRGYGGYRVYRDAAPFFSKNSRNFAHV